MKVNWKTIGTLLWFLTLLFFYSIAIMQFWVGFHNADLAFNFLNLGYSADRVSLDEIVPLEDLWITGLSQMKTSFWLFLIDGILSAGFTFYLRGLVDDRTRIA